MKNKNTKKQNIDEVLELTFSVICYTQVIFLALNYSETTPFSMRFLLYLILTFLGSIFLDKYIKELK